MSMSMSERTVLNDYILELIVVRAPPSRPGSAWVPARGRPWVPAESCSSLRDTRKPARKSGEPRSTAAATCTKHKDASAPNQLPRNILRPTKGCI